MGGGGVVRTKKRGGAERGHGASEVLLDCLDGNYTVSCLANCDVS